MDRGRRGCQSCRLGLPRTRGDGPRDVVFRPSQHGAPPHTRGWTAIRGVVAGAAGGSPAHAGMDPACRRAPSHGRRLPRTRGDGPPRHVAIARRGRAPPHTRGWTLDPADDDRDQVGSPAHAGMDPRFLARRRSRTGLPRTRGDGPGAPSNFPGSVTAPPHTRGWTRLDRRTSHSGRGSPAHAGMDPSAGSRPAPGARLPRTRGDGPYTVQGPVAADLAPPHTRGWTHHTGVHRCGRSGSPAHAGMDPWRSSSVRRFTRLPRTRGDGPRALREARYHVKAPPHTRGWTPRRRAHPCSEGGSPAHAGMDPDHLVGFRDRSRLPRTRGDGPATVVYADRASAAPPHTRGWTRGAGVGESRVAGSPAHAGMDPSRPSPRPSRARLPRTRGDGPSTRLTEAVVAEAPPHTRGWTLCALGSQRGDAGSPAHAGMDP